MSRCKSCDAALTEYEIIWNPETCEHEDLCRKCQSAIYDAETDEEIEGLYNYDINIE